MKQSTANILLELTTRYPALATEKENIAAAYDTLYNAFAKGKRVYLCGNGGSSADCEHMAGELLKSFKLSRPLYLRKQIRWVMLQHTLTI